MCIRDRCCTASNRRAGQGGGSHAADSRRVAGPMPAGRGRSGLDTERDHEIGERYSPRRVRHADSFDVVMLPAGRGRSPITLETVTVSYRLVLRDLRRLETSQVKPLLVRALRSIWPYVLVARRQRARVDVRPKNV